MNERVYELLELVKNTAIQAGNVAADAAYGVGKLAEEALDAAKLRIRAAKVEGAIDGCMMEIGEMMYATHTGDPTDSDELLEKLKEVDDWKEELAQINEALGREPEPPACPTCGAAIREGDLFCRECGGKL